MTPPVDARRALEQALPILKRFGLRHYALCPALHFSDPCTCGLTAALTDVLSAAPREPAQAKFEHLMDAIRYQVKFYRSQDRLFDGRDVAAGLDEVLFAIHLKQPPPRPETGETLARVAMALAKNVRGIVGIEEAAIRELVGNSNVACLWYWCEKVEAAIQPPPPASAAPATEEWLQRRAADEEASNLPPVLAAGQRHTCATCSYWGDDGAGAGDYCTLGVILVAHSLVPYPREKHFGCTLHAPAPAERERRE